MPDDLKAMAQSMISDAEFAALADPVRLRGVLPLPGAAGVAPVLWLATLPRTRRQLGRNVWPLPGVRFGEVDERPHLLRDRGVQAADLRLQVVAAGVVSEAWLREFSPEERAARGSRLIETYPDKVEVVVCMARTLDGRCHLAQAPIQRRASGRLAGYGAWRSTTDGRAGYGRVASPLLEAFFTGYLGGILARERKGVQDG